MIPRPYATVVAAPVVRRNADVRRLLCAARVGALIVHTSLAAQIPDWEAARAEAAALYPDRLIVIPRLGEPVPS